MGKTKVYKPNYQALLNEMINYIFDLSVYETPLTDSAIRAKLLVDPSFLAIAQTILDYEIEHKIIGTPGNIYLKTGTEYQAWQNGLIEGAITETLKLNKFWRGIQ